MDHNGHPLMRQEAARKAAEEKRLDEEAEERRFDASYAAVADTEDGMIVLRHLIRNYGSKGHAFFGNSKDAYNMGMSHACDKLVARLQRCLSRDKFIDLMYPEEK